MSYIWQEQQEIAITLVRPAVGGKRTGEVRLNSSIKNGTGSLTGYRPSFTVPDDEEIIVATVKAMVLALLDSTRVKEES